MCFVVYIELIVYHMSHGLTYGCPGCIPEQVKQTLGARPRHWRVSVQHLWSVGWLVGWRLTGLGRRKKISRDQQAGQFQQRGGRAGGVQRIKLPVCLLEGE